MDVMSNTPESLTGTFKITCENYPSEFNLDKKIAKEYFRQYGKLKRVIFKPKMRTCIVFYANEKGFLNALNNAGEYNGNVFQISGESNETKLKKEAEHSNPIYLEDSELQDELRAMSGVGTKSYQDSSKSILERAKSRRSWKPEISVTLKKIRSKEKIKTMSPLSTEHVDLINLVLSQSTTVDEKFKVLDARDKLLRVKLKRIKHLQSGATLGTCPDMCPEKERLMRVTQHQVALYEQEGNDKTMDYNKAVKQYSRSSADQEAPLSHELRPVPVLQMTMCYLMHTIVDLCDTSDVNLAEWYHFLWDRTRGIRKDITQQELCCQGSVELVEQCARFHIHCSARLVGEEPSVFDQKINTENLTKCLQTLKYMYHDLELKGEYCPNEAEFRAYIILLNLNDGNFMWEVQQLRDDIQKSEKVKFALDVHSAIDKNNYVKFFKLVYKTTYLNACILMRYFVQVRVTALKILLKCYSTRAFKTTYPLTNLMSILGFDDIGSTVDFVQYYGLAINNDSTHIIIEKNMFILPEMPYILDRSLNVESKRIYSVGQVICGKALPDKSYTKHIVQNSFDQKGYLISKDFLDESDLEQVKLKLCAELEENLDADKDISKTKSVSKVTTSSPQSFLFQNVQSSKENIFSNIFSKQDSSNNASQDSNNIFGNQFQSNTSIFSTKTNIFGIEPQPISFPQDQVDKGISQIRVQEINRTEANLTFSFKPIAETTESVGTTTFQYTKTQSNNPADEFSISSNKKGGFNFDLSKPPVTSKLPSFSENVITPIQPNQNPFLPNQGIFSQHAFTPQQSILTFSSDDNLNKEKMVDSEMIISDVSQDVEEKEIVSNKEIEELKRREEMEKLETIRKEEEKIKELKRKQEEELQNRLKQLHEEQLLKNKEIKKSVKDVLDNLVVTVEKQIFNEKISILNNSIRKRKILKVFKKWQDVIQKNKRKRKAIDCSPVWINTKTLKQTASELHSSSQDLTLTLVKRYKYGKPLDIDKLVDEKVPQVNLLELTYSTLNKRFYELTGKIQKTIYWKVVISLPDENELTNGVHRIEDTMDSFFKWTEKNGDIMLIDHNQLNSSESVTYCVEKQKGMLVKESDASGIIFVAKNFNSFLQRRIFENLKGFGVFTKVPIVIILQEYDQNDCKLRALIDAKIVSDYIILIENLNSQALINLVEESLIFLANKVEKSPPLELDTFYSVVEKHLCTEIWKRANSFAKWNSQYKTCLQDPNIVISLYNEALNKLKKIILNKFCREYASFPEVFNEYLRNEIPDYLPCNHFYFPKFWKSQLYIYKLEKMLKDLSLPKWQDKWPPSSELDLEISMSKYCIKAFKVPEKPFYKTMSVLLQNIDPNVNFNNISKVLWTNVIEVLSYEKLKQLNLSLQGTDFENKSIYNQYIVVYNRENIEDYSKSDWFYVNNPLIKKHIREYHMKTKAPDRIDNDNSLEVNTLEDINEIIETTNKLLNKPVSFDKKKLEIELGDFNLLLNDLEASINIQKKISSKFETHLIKAIEES